MNLRANASGGDGDIQLLPVTASDLMRLLTHRNLESTRRWLENDAPIDEAQQQAWFQGGGAAILRLVSHSGRLVALARLDDRQDDEVYVGLDMFVDFRGQGLATECFKAVCAAASQLGRHVGRRLALWVFLDNHAAVAIYRKCGFIEDTQTPVRWLPRRLVAGTDMFAYVKMVREP